VDPRYFRPAEVDLLLGDPAKAKKILKWEPKVTFKALAKMMTEADWRIARRERAIAEVDKKENGKAA
jgi:GDPmannose 4,6-dehydratase